MTVTMTPTGTIIPTVEALSAGIAINKISMTVTGIAASFAFLEMNTTASPPKSAGRNVRRPLRFAPRAEIP